MSYVYPMVTTKQKCIVDSQNLNTRESEITTLGKYKFTKKLCKTDKKKKKKGTKKQLENNNMTIWSPYISIFTLNANGYILKSNAQNKWKPTKDQIQL